MGLRREVLVRTDGINNCLRNHQLATRRFSTTTHSSGIGCPPAWNCLGGCLWISRLCSIKVCGAGAVLDLALGRWRDRL